MKLLFLDNDGVLNRGDQDRHPNRYLPLQWRHVKHLNRVLEAVPDLQIVVSSAWRYHVHNGSMKIEGLESLYMHFGVDAYERIHGVTAKDKHHHGDPEVDGWTNDDWHREGITWRSVQVAEYWKKCGEPTSVVLDDLPLILGDALIQTDKDVGLTAKLADACIRRLT